MTVSGVLTGGASAQGVRQVCPVEVLASAPGGSDSKRTVSMIGAGFKASRFIQSGVDEQAARASAPLAIIMTRYIIILTRLLERRRPPHPLNRIGARSRGGNLPRRVNLTALTIRLAATIIVRKKWR